MDKFPDKKITRRQFIKGTAAVATLPLFSNKLLFYGSLAHAAEESDLVIAKNGGPSQLLQAAMAPLGGMAACRSWEGVPLLAMTRSDSSAAWTSEP